MANQTLVISRSDLFPVATEVKAYPAGSHVFAGPPSGASVAEATVDAAGKLTITVPRESLMLYAEVAGVKKRLFIGDTTAATLPNVGTLKARLKRRRILAGT